MSLHGSALVAPPLAKGSTKPRVFTPPLPANCDTDREDGCACGCGLNPDTSWGFECIDFLEGMLGWRLIPYQKWLYIHALECDEAGDGFRFETLIVLIARQNGKTQWLKGLGLWKLFCDGAEQVLISAQNLELAETTLAEAVADVKANRWLKLEYGRFSQTNGKFRLVLKPRPDDPLKRPREWRTAVSTRKGGRSLSVDLAMLDELREHQTWLAWNAITPTTQARPRSLVVGASNAGDATSIVLRSQRDGATNKITLGETADTQTGLFEWSVPDDVDFQDPQFWPMANPGLGYLPGFTIRRLLGKLESLWDNLAGFKTEYLCMWVDAMEPGVLPAADWQATTDPKSRRKTGAAVWASVDINFELTKAYVGVAARRSDGAWHNELIAAERGTDWVVPWFTDEKRAGKFAGVVVQARGAPASQLIEDLRAAGVLVLELGGPDLTKAYSDYYRELVAHRVWHRPSPTLDAHAAVAQSKNLGDEWVMDRKKNDCSAVIACVQATFGEQIEQEPIYRSAYEDADFVNV
jgi:hypothetical protein